MRPVLVVQNNRGNENSTTLVVAAITAKKKSRLPTHVKLKNVNGIESNSIILLEQLRTIDHMRLKSYIGSVSPMTQGQVDRALAVSVGIAYI